MRIRTTLAAVACAVGVALSLPVSAHAADGAFAYQTVDGIRVLLAPASGQCVTLPEVADENVPPAILPMNDTGSTAVVFANPDCTGDYQALAPQAGGPTPIPFRSVLFS